MSAKVIKLQDNNNNTLLPVTDASLVQMTVGTETKSVQDVILEDEEVTAAGYNELNNRVTALEGADMSNYITQDELSSNSYVTQTSLSSNSYVTQTSLSANGYLTAHSKDFGKVQTITDENTNAGAGTTTKGTMNADAVKDVLQVKGGNKWITTGVSNTTAESTSDNDILIINHAINPSGTATNATLSGTETGTFGSTEYLTALSYSVDAAGHVATITATKVKLPTPTITDEKVKYYSKSDNSSYPLIFSYASTPTNGTTNFVSYDSDPANGPKYNPSTNILSALNIDATNITASTTLKRNSQNVITINNYPTGNDIVTINGTGSYVGKSSGKTITTTTPSSSSTDETVPTSKAVNSAISSALTSVLKYQGTLGTGGTITTLPAKTTLTSADVGKVYVVKTAGYYANLDVNVDNTNEGTTSYTSHLEPGDYVICTWTGSSYVWSAINGDNQVTNYGPTSTIQGTAKIAADGTTGNAVIANVDGVDITLSYAHGTPSGTQRTVTPTGTDTGTFGTTTFLTGISYSSDANGHVTTVAATKVKLPSQSNDFGKIANNASGLKDIITYTAPLTTAGTATADAPQDTLNVYASNYWIRTNVTDTSNTDVLTVGHSLATNTAKYTSQTLYGNESIISTSYGFDAAGHRTTTYNTTYTLSLDASYINITYNETTKSVKDVILENEEITAIALNELNDRVDDTIETVESIAPLIVNISPALGINGIKCDASIDDIQDAYYAGRNVIARTVDGQLNLVQCNSSSVIFTNSHTNTIIYYIGSKVNNSDQWTITTTSLDDYKLKTVYLDLTSTISGNTTTYYLQLNGVTQTYSQIESIYNTGADIKVRTSLNPSSSNEKIVICDLIARNTTQGSFMWHALVNAVLVIPLIFISIGTSNTVSVVTGDLANLQEKLISGTNIKTINSQSLLSSGDIALQTPLTFDNTPTANSNNPVKSGGVKTYVDDSFKNSMLFLKCITNSTQQGAIMQVTSSVTPIEGSIITIYFTHDVPASARLSINGETAKYIQTAISNNNYLDIVSDTIKAYDTATFLKLEDIYYLINVNSIARPNLTSKFIVPSNGAVSLDGSTAAKKIIPNKVYYVASGGESSFTPITSLNIGNNAIINSDSIYSDVTIGTTELTPYEDFIVPVYQIFFKTGSSCSITLGNKMIWKDNLAPASSDLSNKYCELTIMNKIATLISVDIPT